MMMRLVCGVIVLSFISAERGCNGDNNQGGSSAGENEVYFEIEVDYQNDRDPFGVFGYDDVQATFPDCATLDFAFDDDDLPQENVVAFFAKDYWEDHCRKWYYTDGDTTVWRARHPYYIAGISALVDANGDPTDQGGATSTRSEPYRAFSLIAVQTIGPSGYRAQRTCCHELGHQLANLMHLCDAAHLHDTDDCLMSAKDTVECTGEPVLYHIHFCNMCDSAICAIEIADRR